MMHCREVTTDDIDELFSWGTGWDHDYLQLSPGPLGFRMREVRLPGVLIEWNTYGQSVLFREVLREPALVFGFLLDAGGATIYRGRETAPNEALVYHPGQEQEYRNPRNTKALVVIVAPHLAQSLGWNLNERRIEQIPERGLQRLVQVCSEVTEIACRAQRSAVPEAVEKALCDRVLTTLHPLLSPWFAHDVEPTDRFRDPPSTFRLVKHANELMIHRDPAEKLEIANLAAELEVSQRTLYEAFRNCLGIGPYEYDLLRRMHAFRNSLISGKPFHGKVKQIATANGFQHVARLAQAYGRHFGETPRETLRRRSSQ